MKKAKKTIIGIIMLLTILVIEPFGAKTQASASLATTTKREVQTYVDTYLKDYLCYVTQMRYKDPSVKLNYDKYLKTNLALHYLWASGEWRDSFWINGQNIYTKISYGGYADFDKAVKNRIKDVQKKLFGVRGKVSLHKVAGWNYNTNINRLRRKKYFAYNDFYLSKDKKCLLNWKMDSGAIGMKASIKKITKKKNVYTITYNVGVGPYSEMEETHSYKIKLRRKGKSFVICNIKDSKKSNRQLSKKQKRKRALKAYRIMLKDGATPSGIPYPQGTTFLKKDINKDGIPELIVNMNRNCCEAVRDIVFTYYKGKIKEVAISDHGETSIHTKGRVLEKVSGNQGKFTFSLYKIVKGKAKVIAVRKTHPIRVTDDYYIGGKKTTKKKYNAYYKKLTKGSKQISSDSRSWHALTFNAIDRYLK